MWGEECAAAWTCDLRLLRKSRNRNSIDSATRWYWSLGDRLYRTFHLRRRTAIVRAAERCLRQ